MSSFTTLHVSFILPYVLSCFSRCATKCWNRMGDIHSSGSMSENGGGIGYSLLLKSGWSAATGPVDMFWSVVVVPSLPPSVLQSKSWVWILIVSADSCPNKAFFMCQNFTYLWWYCFLFLSLIFSWYWKILKCLQLTVQVESFLVFLWHSLDTGEVMSKCHMLFILLVPSNISEVLNWHCKFFSCQVVLNVSYLICCWKNPCTFQWSANRNILWSPMLKSHQFVQNLGIVEFSNDFLYHWICCLLYG